MPLGLGDKTINSEGEIATNNTIADFKNIVVSMAP
jgi:hypothetical protein